MASRALPAAAVLAAAALAAAGCGGDGSTVTSGGAATATQPARTAPPAAATTRSAPREAQTGASPESQAGGAGDEQGVQVPAVFTFRAGGISPSRVAVPAFLRLRLTGVSRDGRAHVLRFRGTVVHVPAGGRASALVTGLKRGRYGVTADGRADAAAIVSGATPGP